MLKQKFQIGDRVTTIAAKKDNDEIVWIVDGVELRIRIGEDPYIVYSIRKINSDDYDPNGSRGFSFREDELVSLEK